MKKIKYLTLLSLSLFMLTGCLFSDTVHEEIEREIEYSRLITRENEQNSILEALSKAKIGARSNDEHVLSIDITISVFNVISTSLAGYGTYKYNNETEKSNFDLDISGLSNLQVKIDEDQKLNAEFKVANIQALKYENIQLQYEAKPLNEVIDFSLLSSLDKSLIKQYRATNFIDFDTFGRGFQAYVLVLDSNKLNELLNTDLKFDSDPVVSFLTDSGFRTVDIIHISGTVTLTGNIQAFLRVFIYNVNPTN
jgi:hypothetical protein